MGDTDPERSAKSREMMFYFADLPQALSLSQLDIYVFVYCRTFVVN